MKKAYSYINEATIIKYEEKKFINNFQFSSLVESKNIDNLIEILSETSYSRHLSKITKNNIYDIIKLEFDSLIFLYKKLLKEDMYILDILLLKLDMQKLKLKIKEEINHKEVEHIFYTNIDLKEIYLKAREEYDRTKDIQLSCALIDEEYFNLYKKLVKESNIGLLMKIYEKDYEEYNYTCYKRLKKLNISKDLATKFLFDKKYIEAYMKDSFVRPQIVLNIEDMYKRAYGVEVLISHYMLKIKELEKLKLIIGSKINNLAVETIIDELKEIHV